MFSYKGLFKTFHNQKTCIFLILNSMRQVFKILNQMFVIGNLENKIKCRTMRFD